MIRVHEGRLTAEASALVVEVAAELPDPRLVEPILSFEDHEDARIRRLVAGCLGNGVFQDPGSSLAALLADEVPDVRAEAARSAGAGGLVELAPSLGRLLADSTWQVRREAGTALANLGAMGRVVLRCHLHDEDLFARDMAMHILGQMSGLTAASSTSRWVAA
ncbi:MAG: HEAT repeat domain-containing protein [Acidimicrobiales bacterium]